MSDDNKITADDLAKIAASLSVIGYGIALLALEKTSSEKRSKRL